MKFKKFLITILSSFLLTGCAGTFLNVTYTPYCDSESRQAPVYTMNEPVITLDKGESFQLSMKVNGFEVPFPLTWKSEDESVATVNKNGVVTAVGAGTTYALVVNDGQTICMSTIIVRASEEDLMNANLRSIFTMSGVRTPLYSGDGTYLGSRYELTKQVTNSNPRYTSTLLFRDSNKEQPFRFSIEAYDIYADMEFQMDYTFKDSDFLGGSMHIYLHRSPDVDVHYGLNDSFLAGDVSTQRISLKQGYVFPSVSTTKDASYEDKEKAVNMLNYCIEQLYEETAKIHNDLKLF